MDDYADEMPEEREAGRKLMQDLEALLEKFYAAETKEEAEAILDEFERGANQ